MSGYLLDTDWVIDVLNGQASAQHAIDTLDDRVAISIVSCAELFEGVAGLPPADTRRDELERFLARASVINLDTETARTFGNLRASLRAAGQLFGDMDLLIAATAIRHDLTLMSRDHHFDRLDELKRFRN